LTLPAPPFTALRLAAGLTLQALADAVGLSYTSLYRMVRGVTQMPDGVAGRLTNNLGVTRVRSWWRRSHGTGSTSDDRGGKEHHSDRGTVGKQRLWPCPRTVDTS
jgi:transcriptional regulator with XRE-family HTH domain